MCRCLRFVNHSLTGALLSESTENKKNYEIDNPITPFATFWMSSVMLLFFFEVMINYRSAFNERFFDLWDLDNACNFSLDMLAALCTAATMLLFLLLLAAVIRKQLTIYCIREMYFFFSFITKWILDRIPELNDYRLSRGKKINTQIFYLMCGMSSSEIYSTSV